jgi:hypothetical protein
MCPGTPAIYAGRIRTRPACVSSYCMCRHTGAIYVSWYSCYICGSYSDSACMCVRILYVSSYSCCMCVLILLLLYTCPHTPAIYVSSYSYSYICVLMLLVLLHYRAGVRLLLYVCPHAICVSSYSYCYMCPHTPRTTTLPRSSSPEP